MELTELGALGELLGGIAVIGSLIYVGLQVRQSNEVAKAESIRELATEMGRVSRQICDPELARVVRRGTQDFRGLTKDEQLILSGWLGGLFVCAQAAYAMRGTGRSTQAEHFAARWAAMPGLRDWWVAARGNYSPGFAAGIDRLIEEETPMDEFQPWLRD